ncbi:hypothetical protein [Cohnella nanjingensis]|uniref:DUF6199 domain-containing protein n=1 Tax=Cohnella nanjingensis TaxID=1387779 RepID=A0A7X0RSH7_9BACL|nr:hypothetical protein [Cohnella nanjingensis]MBB6671671.1 hypothetical protein [Cohnella nanjingensis]
MATTQSMHTAALMLSLALVFWTGSAIFVVLHPRAVWRLVQGRRWETSREPESDNLWLIRIQGIFMGAAGLLLLVVPQLREWLPFG